VTSNINYAAINENFPRAGQDNDTQVFRDNFNQIKDNFIAAKSEIEDLQQNAARTDQDNEFFGNKIVNAMFVNTTDVIIPSELAISSGIVDIEFASGAYQIITLGDNATFNLTGFPADSTSVGKVTLELYTNDALTPREITFSLSGTGATQKKKNNFPSVGGAYDLEALSDVDPVIVEIWRHGPDTFFMNYVGQFS